MNDPCSRYVHLLLAAEHHVRCFEYPAFLGGHRSSKRGSRMLQRPFIAGAGCHLRCIT